MKWNWSGGRNFSIFWPNFWTRLALIPRVLKWQWCLDNLKNVIERLWCLGWLSLTILFVFVEFFVLGATECSVSLLESTRRYCWSHQVSTPSSFFLSIQCKGRHFMIRTRRGPFIILNSSSVLRHFFVSEYHRNFLPRIPRTPPPSLILRSFSWPPEKGGGVVCYINTYSLLNLSRNSFYKKNISRKWKCTERLDLRVAYFCKKLYPLDTLHPNISMHILHTVLRTFPKVLTRRICLTINNFFSCW